MSGSTAATSAPGTSAAAARPSGSTTSTRRTSSPGGSSRCASWGSRRSRPTRCSTTTRARPIRAPSSDAWRRPRPTLSSCGVSSTLPASPRAAASRRSSPLRFLLSRVRAVDVLALIHGSEVRAGVFADPIRDGGHRVEEWSLAWGKPPPRPIDAYGAVIVFGGAMHADQDHHHPWLKEENLLLQRLLDLHRPVLGVCLGAQLLAKATHAPVGPAREPEIGWYPVELTDAGEDDPVLGRLPRRFDAFP